MCVISNSPQVNAHQTTQEHAYFGSFHMMVIQLLFLRMIVGVFMSWVCCGVGRGGEYAVDCVQKKKWKPALRETLNKEKELMFEPKERNQCIFRNTEASTSQEQKKEEVSMDLGISLYRRSHTNKQVQMM